MFNTIGLLCKPDAPEIGPTVQALYDFLTERKLTVLAEQQAAKLLSLPADNTVGLKSLGKKCDLVISIGGDGTLLTAARSLIQSNVPLIGVNLGRLGFLVDISPEDMFEKIHRILSGNFHEEERVILETRIVRAGQLIHSKFALNEVSIHRHQSPGLIEIETHINDIFLNSLRGDGLIVSTPTGSTAYALSCGGPLMHPSLNALLLVPINPHMLSNRPIVIDGSSKVDIVYTQRYQHEAQIACDNVVLPGVEEGDHIVVTRAQNPVRLLHPVDHNFFEIARAKLHWSGPS